MSEFDHDVAAAKLYSPDQQTKQQNTEPSNDDTAEAMFTGGPYDSLPIHVRQMLEPTDEVQARVLGRTAAERQEYARTIAQLDAAGLPSFVVQDLLKADLEADQAEAHGRAEPDAVATQQNAEQLRADLIDVYGVKGAEQWLTETSKFVAATPALKAILSRRGYAARKNLVLPILEHVRRQRLGM